MKYYIAALPSDPLAMTRLEYAEDERNVATLNALQDLFRANWAAGKVVARGDDLEPLRARVAGDARLTSFACTSRGLPCCYFAATEPVQEALLGMSILPSAFHPIAVDKARERYSLFHTPSVANDAVVFSASRFFVGTPLGLPRNYQHIDSNEEYLALLQKPGFALLQPEYIEVRSDLLEMDVLQFRFAGTFFSERLAEVVRRKGFSGLNLIPASLDGHPRRLYFYNTGVMHRGSGASC